MVIYMVLVWGRGFEVEVKRDLEMVFCNCGEIKSYSLNKLLFCCFCNLVLFIWGLFDISFC